MALAKEDKERQSIYRKLFKAHVDASEIELIREATNKGLIIGGDRFKDEIEQLTERRVRESKRGPKPRLKEFLL